MSTERSTIQVEEDMAEQLMGELISMSERKIQMIVVAQLRIVRGL